MLNEINILPLKEATAEKHKQAERMPFNAAMFKGLLSQQQYLVYLEQQLALFQAFEKEPLPHPALQRVKAIEEDIQELIDAGCSKKGILNSTKAYVEYIKNGDAASRLAHIYLNYLALLFGGQMMKKHVPSAGKIYVFEHTPECIQSIRQLQQDSWADEVNRGFDFIIEQFEELAQVCEIKIQSL